MFKTIPGNDEFLISHNAEIRRCDGGAVRERIDDGKIAISLYGVKRRFDLTWLAMIAHFELFLPNGIKDLLNVNFANLHPFFSKRSASGKTPFFLKPIVVIVENKIYRVIPSHSQYAVSPEGVVIEISTGKVLKVMKEQKREGEVVSEYPSVHIYNPPKMGYRYVMVHRLVAMAWVDNPGNDYFARPIVNHKDGNKKNFHWTNLEWCTFLENNVHAVNTGLRDDNFECKIRDFRTGEIREFASLSQAESFMGLRDTKLRVNAFYQRKSKLLSGKYEIKLKSDNTPWFYEGRVEKAKQGRYFITVTHLDGRVEYFHDIRDFRIQFKTWNCPDVKNVIARAKAQNPGMKIDLIDFYHSEDIQARKVETGEVFVTKTISAMSKLTGIPEHAIRFCLNGQSAWTKKGYAFRYKSDEPWPEVFIDKTQRFTIRFKATHPKTNEEMIFNSMRQAAVFFRGDRSWLRHCLINDLMVKGWRLTEIRENN